MNKEIMNKAVEKMNISDLFKLRNKINNIIECELIGRGILK